jgi:PKD repeat protein
VPQAKTTRYAVLFALTLIISIALAGFPRSVHAVTSYSLTPLPFVTQEGYSVLLILNVIGAAPGTLYQFNFHVRDPSTKVWNSILENYTTFSGQTQFSLLPSYPSAAFIGAGGGTSSFVGQYVGWVNQTTPVLPTNTAVAVTTNGFFFILTDHTEYQRTDTVGIRASGYNSLEVATVIIRTQTSSTVVLNATTIASSTGLVTASWKIPKTATIDNYVVTVTGKITAKSPPDAQGFVVRTATMSISALTSSKASYQRTETMKFSFKASYPDGQYANSGTALLSLASPGGNRLSLTAVYDSVAQTFNATYKTFFNNQTGIWTASLGVNGFDDGFGNNGPSTLVSTSPQLQPASFAITITSKSYFAIGEQIKFNATIQYPDLTELQSGQVGAFLLFSGGGHNDTILQFAFDSTLNLWVGTYTPGNEPGGLWSLTVAGADSASPANSGKATKTIQLQDRLPVSIFTFTSGIILTAVPVSFDGTSSYDPDGIIVGYAWDFGDGSTGSGATSTHGYSIAGTYAVKLNVTDNSGSTAVSTQTVIITDRPPTVTLTLSSTAPAPGQAVIITISASDPDGTIATTTVNWGDGTTDTISGPPTTDSHAYSLANGTPSATYTITVTTHDNSGSTASATPGITVTDRPPVITWTPPAATAVSGQAVTVAISSSDPDGTVTGVTVNWGDGKVDTLTPGTTTDSHTYSLTSSSPSATYTITVTVVDNSGSTKTATSSIAIQPIQSGSNISFPLYYFGILAALIAALLIGTFLAFRRHKVTHARLKIDLEAVKAEAGRIENQEFFQSVKDQLKKDKE